MQQADASLPREPVTVSSTIAELEKTIQDHCDRLTRKFLERKPTIKKKKKVDSGDGPELPDVPPTAVRKDKVKVFVRIVFLKIGEIDTLKENFNADCFVQASWREPFLDDRLDIEIEEIDWEKYWNPKLYIENTLGDPKESVWQTLVFNKQGEATVHERRRLKGCFQEKLELNEFPFDTQDLTITITSERPVNELVLDEDLSQVSSINIQSFVDEQEWRLHSHVDTTKRSDERVEQMSQSKHPAISASCRASRRPGFFVWNIFLVMLLIGSLAFATFTVDPGFPQNRLQLSFILLLTTITFKFVVSQTIPRIPYLTYLDKYILTSMAILCTVCVWHSIVPLLRYDKTLTQTADRCALIVFWTTYILFHLIFFVYVCYIAWNKNRSYTLKDKAHKERMKRLVEEQKTASL